MTAEEKFVVARFRTEIVVTSENGALPIPFWPGPAHDKKYKGNKLWVSTHGMAESDIERGRKTFKSGKNGPLWPSNVYASNELRRNSVFVHKWMILGYTHYLS